MRSHLTSRAVTRGAAAVAVIAALVWFGGGPASAVPALVATPSADLLDGQTVQVSGSGFGSDALVYVAMCPAGATLPSECNAGAVTMGNADGSGAFTLSFSVSRYFGTLDCAVDACSIGATDFSSNALTPVTFRDVAPPTPAITVSPDTGLVDGSTVTISGTGFRPGAAAQPGQCPPGAIAINFCNQPGGAPTVLQDGTFQAQIPVERILNSATSTDDCAVSQCTIGVDALGVLVTAPISFSTPVFTATIEPMGTLAAGTDLVVVRATVACDIATPISVLTVVSQPEIAGQARQDHRQCAPGAPFEGYYATRGTFTGTGHFSLGSATVQVTIWPTGGHAIDAPSSSSTTVTGSTNLIDDAQIRAAIFAQIQDPANVELRQAVFHGIQLRLQQDPIFAVEFFRSFL